MVAPTWRASVHALDSRRMFRNAARRAGLVRVAVSVVLIALVFAAVSHGAFYGGELRMCLGLILVALAAALVGVPLSRRDLNLPIVAAATLAGWYVVAGVVSHDVGGATPAVELLVVLTSVIVIVRRADHAERAVLVDGLLAIGLIVAVTGWWGVVWHQAPHALVDGGLWRAASTVTYANATGGLLAALTIIALGLVLADESRRRLYSLVAFIMLVGLFATLSRAALVAFAAGFVVIAVLSAGRVLRSAWPIVVGATVATCGLLPSMPATHQPRPALAVAALLFGGLVASVPPRAVAIGAACFGIAFVAIPGVRTPLAHAFQPLRENRVTLSSPDRAHETTAAIQLVRAHPLFGAGPGAVDLTWPGPWLTTMHIPYAHDEYLQVLDETGIVGGAIVLAGLGAVGLSLWRVRRTFDSLRAVACLGALVALGVHSAMDFLWHVPLIPIVGAMLVGLLLPATPTRRDDIASEGGRT